MRSNRSSVKTFCRWRMLRESCNSESASRTPPEPASACANLPEARGQTYPNMERRSPEARTSRRVWRLTDRDRSDAESADESQHDSFPIGKPIVGCRQSGREGCVHKWGVIAVKSLHYALVVQAFAPYRNNRLPLMAVDSKPGMGRYPVTLEGLASFDRERRVPAMKKTSGDGESISCRRRSAAIRARQVQSDSKARVNSYITVDGMGSNICVRRCSR